MTAPTGPTWRESLTDRLPAFWHEQVRLFGRGRVVGAVLVLTVLWAGLVFWTPASAWLDRLLLDQATRFLAGWRTPDPRLALVAIDTATLDLVPHRWPWPRTALAGLLDAVASTGAELVLLDLVLQHADDSPGDGDAVLEATLRRLQRVGLVSLVEQSMSRYGLRVEEFHSLKRFRQVARLEGFAWAEVDSDGILRGFVAQDQRLGIDSLVLGAARQLLGQPLALPADRDGLARSLLAPALRDGGILCLSARDLLEDKIPPDTLSGAIVVLCVTADILHDWHGTAIGVRPGGEVLAQTLDTLVQGRVARRNLGWGWRLAAGLVGGCAALLLAGVAGAWRHILALAGLAGVLAVGAPAGLLAGAYPPWAVLGLSWLFWLYLVTALGLLRDLLSLQQARAEGDAVRLIQAQLFPRRAWDSPAGYRCSGLCLPCDAASGDYYDLIEHPDGNCTFLIADVSGHGVAAGMVAVMAKALATLVPGSTALRPSQLLQNINAVLHATLRRQRFMTALVGHIDTGLGRVDLAFGGHPSPFLVHGDGRVVEVACSSMPLGFKPTLAERCRELVVAIGDHLVLYTDGVPEALDWDNQQYGYAAWERFLARAVAGQTHEVVIERIVAELRRHAAGRPFTDDVTLVVLSRERPRALLGPAGPTGPVEPVEPAVGADPP